MTYRATAAEDPTAVAEELIRQGFEIDHIEGDVISYYRPAPLTGSPTGADALPMAVRGLNTDDFSQEPTIDADRSAAWNRKAKSVKPGSFAARRMAAED